MNSTPRYSSTYLVTVVYYSRTREVFPRCFSPAEILASNGEVLPLFHSAGVILPAAAVPFCTRVSGRMKRVGHPVTVSVHPLIFERSHCQHPLVRAAIALAARIMAGHHGVHGPRRGNSIDRSHCTACMSNQRMACRGGQHNHHTTVNSWSSSVRDDRCDHSIASTKTLQCT